MRDACYGSCRTARGYGICHGQYGVIRFGYPAPAMISVASQEADEAVRLRCADQVPLLRSLGDMTERISFPFNAG